MPDRIGKVAGSTLQVGEAHLRLRQLVVEVSCPCHLDGLFHLPDCPRQFILPLIDSGKHQARLAFVDSPALFSGSGDD